MDRGIRLKQLVSGGQTGVDRAGLDFAIGHNIEYTGFIPKGRRAEDGRIADKYVHLIELKSRAYRDRTIKNLRYADGTLLIFERFTGGVKLTYNECKKHNKPIYVIDLNDNTPLPEHKEKFDEWILNNGIAVLNIAGNRESNSKGIYKRAITILEHLLLT
ncbi:MAG: putative molybdenum carrier protein [Ignavibacteriales bacterium]